MYVIVIAEVKKSKKQLFLDFKGIYAGMSVRQIYFLEGESNPEVGDIVMAHLKVVNSSNHILYTSILRWKKLQLFLEDE